MADTLAAVARADIRARTDVRASHGRCPGDMDLTVTFDDDRSGRVRTPTGEVAFAGLLDLLVILTALLQPAGAPAAERPPP